METSTRLASPAPPPEPGAPQGAAPQGRAPTHLAPRQRAAERQQRQRPVSQTPSPASPACPTPPLGPELGQRAEKQEGRGRNGDRVTRAVTGAEHSAEEGSERNSPEKPDRKRPTSGNQQIQVGTKHDFHGLKSVNSVLAVRLISSFVLDMQV